MSLMMHDVRFYNRRESLVHNPMACYRNKKPGENNT